MLGVKFQTSRADIAVAGTHSMATPIADATTKAMAFAERICVILVPEDALISTSGDPMALQR